MVYTPTCFLLNIHFWNAVSFQEWWVTAKGIVVTCSTHWYKPNHGWSWFLMGLLILEGVDHNLQDHMVQMCTHEGDRQWSEKFLGLPILKFSQMSIQWANPVPEIKTRTTRYVMDQAWNRIERSGARQKGVCSVTGRRVRTEWQREGIKAALVLFLYSNSMNSSFHFLTMSTASAI